MKTASLICEPAADVIFGGVEGQEVEPLGTMQTVPVGPVVVKVDGDSN
jgi:hypothetical protein